MAEDQTQQDDQTEDEAATPDRGGQTVSAPSPDNVTAFSQEYVGKLLAEERKTVLRKFKESDEYKNLTTRAQQANEVDELRQKVTALETDKAGAAARYESIVVNAQLKSEMARRGIPDERIDDALILTDKSNVKVDWGKGGIVSGADEAVQGLVESRPWFVGPGVGAITTQANRPAPNLNGGTRGTSATEEAQIQQAMREMAQQGIGRI